MTSGYYLSSSMLLLLLLHLSMTLPGLPYLVEYLLLALLIRLHFLKSAMLKRAPECRPIPKGLNAFSYLSKSLFENNLF